MIRAALTPQETHDSKLDLPNRHLIRLQVPLHILHAIRVGFQRPLKEAGRVQEFLNNTPFLFYRIQFTKVILNLLYRNNLVVHGIRNELGPMELCQANVECSDVHAVEGELEHEVVSAVFRHEAWLYEELLLFEIGGRISH